MHDRWAIHDSVSEDAINLQAKRHRNALLKLLHMQ
jgi:hypothetical protein